jgi:hypothetical protein
MDAPEEPQLHDIDSADRAQLMRVVVYFGPPCFVLLSLLWFFLRAKGMISGGVFAGLIVLNVPLTVAGIFAIHRTVGAAATGLVHTMFAAGNIAPAPSYSAQETLIVRGRYDDAAESFRAIIAERPEELDARLALARLLEDKMNDPTGAERLYQDVRGAEPPPNPRQVMAAANGLIDLYRRTGRTDRLKVELARFADRYRGTRAAAHATRELLELKTADLTSESPRSPT